MRVSRRIKSKLFEPVTTKHTIKPMVEKKQIINLLGIEVGQSSLIDGNNRINISHLPAGVYYIKIGDKVEKFLKM